MPSNTFVNAADSPSFYSVPIPGTEEDGYTAIRRNPDYDKILTAADFTNVKTSWDLFQNGLRKNPNGPCIGKREVLPDGSLGEYKFKTYKEVDYLSRVVGTSLINLGIVTEQPSDHPNIPPCKLVGLFFPSCEEWLLCEQGCYAYGFTLVPIYHTLTIKPIHFILEITRIELLFCSLQTISIMLSVLELGMDNLHLKVIILTNADVIPDEVLNSGFNVKFMLWGDFIALGEKKLLPITPGSVESLNTISFTSGTTGMPKGVLITHKNFIDIVVVTLHTAVYTSQFPKDVFSCHISYLPMAHLFEKTFLNAIYYHGGRVGLNSGDVKMVLNDIQTLKPTLFVSVPRLYQRIHDKILAGVSSKIAPVRALFYHGLRSKIDRIKSTGVYSHYIYDKLIFKKIQNLLGGQVRWLFIGSSSMSPVIVDRIKAFFGRPFTYGYALTESTAGGFIQHISDVASDHCGGPIATLQFRLRSVPDLNYFVDSKIPRGELLIRGNNVTFGYFRSPEETDKAIIDGWLHTGDIVELLGNGAIKIIDRIKQLFKLSQGEYIAPEYIESIICSSPYVSQAFVCGKSDQPFPVAIIVPDEEQLSSWSIANGLGDLNFTDLCKTEQLYKLIMDDLNQLFVANKLKGYESVKAIYLEPEPFSIENNILTVTSKIKRNIAKDRYKNEIDKMYNTL